MAPTKKPKLASSSSPPKPDTDHHPPWLDLPSHLTEKIMERLPLSDYIRFGAVCTKWRSLQTSHRLRYSPLPPPNRPFPWLLPSILHPNQDSSPIATCYSPFERKLYSLQLDIPENPHLLHTLKAFPYAHGWLLLFRIPYRNSSSSSSPLSLFNPISNARIEIPYLHMTNVASGDPVSVAISSSPLLPKPHCSLLSIPDETHLYLLRLGQPEWTPLRLPPHCLFLEPLTSPVFAEGKFYCLLVDRNLVVVDPSTAPAVPVVEYLEMGGFQTVPEWERHHFVECDGDVLFVGVHRDRHGEIVGFRLFRADTERKEWVEMESLGGRVLFLCDCSSYSVLAADAGMRGNCIFYTSAMTVTAENPWARWKIFDLGTGKVKVKRVRLPKEAHQFKCLEKVSLRWFVPTLC